MYTYESLEMFFFCRLGEKQSEIVRLTAELGNKETETKARVDEKESEIQTLTSSLNTQIGEIEKLREEIQAFKNKNDVRTFFVSFEIV